MTVPGKEAALGLETERSPPRGGTRSGRKLTLPPDMNDQDALWQLEKALNQKWVVDRRKRYR